MWYQVKAYLKFLLRSTNQHGVHSPFVYDLVTKCFYDKTSYEDYSKLINYKKKLLNNQEQIKINDLGAGSRVKKGNKRSVSSISKNSGTTLKRAKLLYRLVKYYNPKSILELGTSLGIGTQAMSLAKPDASIITIEGCSAISKYTEINFNMQWLDNINQLTGDFKEFLPELSKNTYDLIFFDGNHTKEATLNYFEMLLPTASNNSVFIFDDIYWSKGMTEAWETIKLHPKVTVTIDTFSWGFVFFRKEQEKEHFTIRI